MLLCEGVQEFIANVTKLEQNQKLLTLGSCGGCGKPGTKWSQAIGRSSRTLFLVWTEDQPMSLSNSLLGANNQSNKILHP
jgi:hypothetical protein